MSKVAAGPVWTGDEHLLPIKNETSLHQLRGRKRRMKRRREKRGGRGGGRRGGGRGGRRGGRGGRRGGGRGGNLIVESPPNVFEVLVIQEMDAVILHPLSQLSNAERSDLRAGVPIAMDEDTGEDGVHYFLQLLQLGLKLMLLSLQPL